MARKKSEGETPEKANLMDARWINTPFAFARFGKDFTLLQQHVMLIVSDHLQDYLSAFFKKGRHLETEDPLSLFDKETLAAGIPDLKINVSEFQIGSNNNYELYKAFNEVSHVQLKVPVYENGVLDRMDWLPVFSKMSIPLTPNTESDFVDFDYRRGYVEMKINPLVASYAFNMRLGYVNHPLNIAKDSNQTYAPRLYFLVKHKMAKGRRSVTIPYDELRKELGMQIIDPETHEVTSEMYPQFSKFKTKVLDAAISDIDRMSNQNLIDVKLSYELVYRNGVQRGNPQAVNFTVTLSPLGEFHKDPKKHRAHMEITIIPDSATSQPAKKRGRPKKVTPQDPNEPNLFDQAEEVGLIPGDKKEIWEQILREYNGPMKEKLEKTTFLGTEDGALMIEVDNLLDLQELSGEAVSDQQFKDLLAKYRPEQFQMKRIRFCNKHTR